MALRRDTDVDRRIFELEDEIKQLKKLKQIKWIVVTKEGDLVQAYGPFSSKHTAYKYGSELKIRYAITILNEP